MTDEFGNKWLPAARLIVLFGQLPPDSHVMPNAVGNLLVLSDEDEESLAYVDLAGEGSVKSLRDAGDD
jgi:hypothetical protein